MKKRHWAALGVLAVVVCAYLPASADDTSHLGFLPPAHELFKPLRADPRELQYALRIVLPVHRRSLGEAAMGDYLGLYRWKLSTDASFQISVGGGVFARFDLAEQSNSLQVSDYYGNLPFDFRVNKWSFRFMPYHTSSHLGDDYLSKTGGTTTKHTWDNLRWLASYDLNAYGRMYGGYTYTFRELPGHLGRNAFQGGFEAYSPWMGNGLAQVYWANDLQSWERTNWNPMFDSQVGVKLAKDHETGRALSLFAEFETGPQPQGQFMLNHETRWNLGIKFDLT